MKILYTTEEGGRFRFKEVWDVVSNPQGEGNV